MRTAENGESQPGGENVRAAIDAALRPLLGKPLWWVLRVIDLQTFGFGDRLAGRGRNPTVPELSLHVQCRWRVVKGDAIVVGSADIFWPPDGSDVGYDDFDYDGTRSRRDELLDGFMQHGEAAHVVIRAVGRGTGDAVITFRDGCVLELWPDHRSGGEAGGPEEHWRFFARDQDPHFVVTSSRVST